MQLFRIIRAESSYVGSDVGEALWVGKKDITKI